MKKNIVFIVSFILLAIGIIIGCFSFPSAELIGFAVAMFGAGTLCIALWKNRKPETPTWLSIVALVLVGVGAFICGMLELLELDVFKEVIGYIVAIVMIIVGALVPKVFKPKVKEIKD